MKVEANELRIGSLVTLAHKSNSPIVTVITFYESGIHYGMGKTHPFNLLLPIPLTEEWLTKSGGIKTSKNNPMTPYQFVVERFILVYFASYKYWYVTDNDTGTYLTKIEFVHEWQNFYKAMQGVELTINRKPPKTN